MRLLSGRVRARSATPRELLSRLGRAGLWFVVAVVLLRGLPGIIATEPRPASSHVVPSAPVWPDDAARAYAAEFASAYLRVDPAAGAEPARAALAVFTAPEIVDRLAPELDVDAARQQALSVSAAGATRVDESHALITVAAMVSGKRPRSVRLTVPVARDGRGGLVVYDLPALAPAPDRAKAEPAAGTPILGAEGVAINDVLTRFLRAYVSGDRAGLAISSRPGRGSP